MDPAAATVDRGPRWALYRLLSDPFRLRLLALSAAAELAVGELAELLGEGQPKVSRQAAALRDAGLLGARKHGTWVLLRTMPQAADDAVVRDALAAGRELVSADGTLERVGAVIDARDAATREFFARAGRPARGGVPEELGAYLSMVAPLLAERRLAVDAGTGDGSLLEVLSPLFERVIALDRSAAQLALARERVERGRLGNVRLVCGELDGPEIARALRDEDRRRRPGGGSAARASSLGDGADAVFAIRLLHHAAVPGRALGALGALCRPPRPPQPGGTLVVLDYERHHDETMRARHADLWLGFEPAELEALARDAGLVDIRRARVPAAWHGRGPDRHLGWQLLSARRPPESFPRRRRRPRSPNGP